MAYTAKVPEFLWVWCGSQEREPDLLILRRNPAKGNTWMDEMTSVEGQILETKRPVQASWVTREDMAHKGTVAERSPERKYWAIKKEATLESAAPRGHGHQLLYHLFSPLLQLRLEQQPARRQEGVRNRTDTDPEPLLFPFPGWRRREMLNQNWHLQFWSDTGWDWFILKDFLKW